MRRSLELLELIDRVAGHQRTANGDDIRVLTEELRQYFRAPADLNAADWPGEVAESLNEDKPPVESYDEATGGAEPNEDAELGAFLDASAEDVGDFLEQEKTTREAFFTEAEQISINEGGE